MKSTLFDNLFRLRPIRTTRTYVRVSKNVARMYRLHVRVHFLTPIRTGHTHGCPKMHLSIRAVHMYG